MKKFSALLMSVLFVLVTAGAAFCEEISAPELGLTLDIPAGSRLEVLSLETGSDAFEVITLLYYNEEALLPVMERYEKVLASNDPHQTARAENELTEQISMHTQRFFDILIVETGRTEEVRSLLSEATCLGANSTHSYYLLKESDDPAFAEEDRTMLEEARKAAEDAVSGIRISEIGALSVYPGASGVPAWMSTVDMNGAPADITFFAQADLTVLNVWDTTCNPCISEMPELAAWAEELPDNVQLAGLILDVTDRSGRAYENAKTILEKSGVSFVNLLYNSTWIALTNTLIGTPTTFFVDSTGTFVGEPVLGANVAAYKLRVAEILGE